MVSGATAKRWWQEEDWLAVVLGFVLIAATLAGARWLTPRFAWSGMGDAAALVSGENLALSLQLGAVLLLISMPGVRALGGDQRRYALAFPAVFALAWLAQALSGHRAMAYWGIEYIIPALLLGLLVSNVLGLPAWLREAVRTEYFIKTGIVIMGATMLFSDLVEAGALGMLQAVLVVAVVWAAAFRLSKRLRLDDEFAAMISTAVAICGVSAAIAACGAIQGDRRKLSYVASVVLIVALPMIVLQPWLIRVMGLPDAVGGAWLGGTLDTTASVVAAGALVSEQAMKIGAIVKFAQNLLIGVAAFALAVWWTMRENPGGDRPSARVIWERFPVLLALGNARGRRGRQEHVERPADRVVRAGLCLHRPGNAVRGPVDHGAREAAGGVRGRAGGERGLDADSRPADFWRLVLGRAADLRAATRAGGASRARSCNRARP